MGKINIQMYSFMDGKHNDSRENLKTAARMGYDGVELFGPDFQIPAEEMKELTEKLGIRVVSMHAPDKHQIVSLLPYANTVGCSFIGLSMEVMRDEADVLGGVLTYLAQDEGVVGAAKDDGVDFRVACEQLVNILLDEVVHAGAVVFASLDERNP